MTTFISVCISGRANLKHIEKNASRGSGHALPEIFEILHSAMAFLVLLNKF